MTRKGKVRSGLGLIILAVSISFLVWGYWPAHREMRVRPVSVNRETTASVGRALTLLFPPKIRVGEAGVVRLTLDVGAVIDSLLGDGESGVLSFYNTHNVVAEARFDLPGIPARPSELISAPVSPGQTAVFYWTVRPSDAGKFRGTIWLYLRVVDKLTGQERRETLSAQIIEMETIRFLGLDVNRVRMIGLAAGLIGLFLSLPLFRALVVRLLRKRSKIL
jgi:hypothetical protein